ncbi:hypothetical protein BGZ72_003903, partial [Mortierella alpina]
MVIAFFGTQGTSEHFVILSNTTTTTIIIIIIITSISCICQLAEEEALQWRAAVTETASTTVYREK